MAWRAAAILAGVLLATGLAVAAPGEVRLTPRSTAAAHLCASRRPRADRELLAGCAQVRGRVLWVRRADAETHLAVVGALHLLVVKLAPEAAAPRIGTSVAYTGALVRSRSGFRELEAW